MKPEDLLKILKDNGLDDEAIKKLLKDCLESFEPEIEKDEEKAKDEEDYAEGDKKRLASKLLGVTL